MTVSNGQDVNATVTNAAFMSRTANTSTTGVVNLNNTSDANSGDEVINAQRLINEVSDSDGTDGEGDANRKVYSSNRVVSDGDDRKVAIGKLDSKMPTSPSTTGGVIAATGTTAVMESNSGVRITSNENLTVDGTLDVVGVTTLDTVNAGSLVLSGDLTVNGTTTTIDTATLDVEDANITVNSGGNDASSEGSGLTVERASTDGSFVYEDALTSKFKLGALGSEVEVATVSGQQQLTNKDFDGGTASNASRMTVPKAATGTLSSLTRKQGTILYDTTLDVLKYDDGTSLLEIGSGSGGSGGINHLTHDDVDAENSVGNWAAYQNLAGEEPVDGFGNSPTVTVARTDTNPLRGAGSFLLTKDGFDRQGEGASVDFSIGRSDALISQRQEVSFEYEGSSNLVVGDGGDLNVFIYDDDTDTLIRPEQIFLTSQTGKYLAHWNIQDDESRNYRLILHISTTSTLAWTFKFDQVSVGPQSTIVGPAMTDWTDFPMVITTTGTNPTKGTIVTDSAFWRRVGDSMEIRYDYQQSAGGTAGTGSSYIFGLPSGYAADTQKVFLDLVNNDLGKVGDCNTFDGTSREHGDVKLISATGLNLIVFNQTNGYGNVASGRVDLSNATVRYTFTAKVPISGWTSNVAVGNGQTFRISNIIANGTRVTSTPTRLGEWRSQLRNAGARTFTDTNGEPSSLPSAADGIKVFHSASFATADSNNEPSRYEIFLGKNKQIKMESYLSTGRTGFHDPSPHIAASLENIGYVTNYDPATGVFVITPVLYQANNNRTGFQSDGDVTSADWFMDLVVSENVQAIGVDLAHSEVWVYSASGYGSTNTKIRTFSTVGKNEGNAITYASDGTNGDSFTINESGVYSMHYHDQFSAASNFGISLNSNQLTTNLVSITAANRLIGVNTGGAGAIGVASTTVKLSRGDVIRAHGDAVTTGGSTWGDGFRITKVH